MKKPMHFVWARLPDGRERPIASFATIEEAGYFAQVCGPGLSVRTPDGRWIGRTMPSMPVQRRERASTEPHGLAGLQRDVGDLDPVAIHVGLMASRNR